jgi:hypothetical protein
MGRVPWACTFVYDEDAATIEMRKLELF